MVRVELGIPAAVISDESLGAVWNCGDLFGTGQADIQDLVGVIADGWKLGVDGYLPGHEDHLSSFAAEEERKAKAKVCGWGVYSYDFLLLPSTSYYS